MMEAFDECYAASDWWILMKIRFSEKSDYQKKLDRQLFEAVGNGDFRHGPLGYPHVNTVKQLILNGATVDHFVPIDYKDGVLDEGNLNPIDMAMFNKQTAALEVLKVLVTSFPEYKKSPVLNGFSLLGESIFDENIEVATYLIRQRHDNHPLYSFMVNAFDNGNNLPIDTGS